MNNRLSRNSFVRVFGLVALLVLVFVVSIPASANTSGSWTIYEDTTLVEDHDGNIVIGEDGVTLDCAGHTITGSGNGNGILLPGREGVTVRNCHVTGFDLGIFLDWSSGSTIESNLSWDNAYDGIRLNYSNQNALTGN